MHSDRCGFPSSQKVPNSEIVSCLIRLSLTSVSTPVEHVIFKRICVLTLVSNVLCLFTLP